MNQYLDSEQQRVLTRMISSQTSNVFIRFYSKVLILTDDECWEWQACCHRDGHGKFGYQYKTYYSHRFAYFLKFKKFPSRSYLHICNNPKCVNLKHLKHGTSSQNIIEAGKDGLMQKGEARPSSKLTSVIVKKIRYLSSSCSHGELARIYKVSISTIRRIVRREKWIHVI